MPNDLRDRVKEKMIEVLSPTEPDGIRIDELQDEVVKRMPNDPEADVRRYVWELANFENPPFITTDEAMVLLTTWLD